MQAYTLCNSILDPVELSLYRALTLVLCQRAVLFTKIRVNDLFVVNTFSAIENEWEQVADQQLDFVLCDRDSIRPIGVVLFETEQAFYGQHDQSDQVVHFCNRAGLPVVRLKRQPAYFMQQIMGIIEPILSGNGTTIESNRNHQLRESAVVEALGGLNRDCKPKRKRKLPAYPGYGALRTIANKLA